MNVLPFTGLRSVWKDFSDQATQDLSALNQLSDIFSSVTTANQEKLVPVSTPPVPPDFVPHPSVAPPAPGPRVEPVRFFMSSALIKLLRMSISVVGCR
jgi:hypothetical protein